MANINLDQVEKLIVSSYRRYYETRNIDRTIISTFIDAALKDCGLVITDDFKLEELKVHNIKPKFKTDDVIKAKDDEEELKIYDVSYDCYVCSGGNAVMFEDQDKWELVYSTHSINYCEEHCKGYQDTGKCYVDDCPYKPKLSHSEVTKESGQELTEFEKLLQDEYADENVLREEGVHNIAQKLLSAARKQFIKEAYGWLEERFYVKDEGSGRGVWIEITSNDFDSIEEMKEDFRKALEKGE